MRYIPLGDIRVWNTLSRKTYTSTSSLSLEKNTVFETCVFSNLHIDSENLVGFACLSSTFKNVHIVNSTFDCSTFFDSTFIQCTFEECTFFHANFEYTTWNSSTMLGTIFPHSRFIHAILNDMHFEDCDIKNVLFSNEEKTGMSFSICNDEEAYFDITI